MRILVAFEQSGIVVRDAFIAAGHDATSCDLKPTARQGPHIQGDARPLLLQPWDLVIAHPPCQYPHPTPRKPRSHVPRPEAIAYSKPLNMPCLGDIQGMPERQRSRSSQSKTLKLPGGLRPE